MEMVINSFLSPVGKTQHKATVSFM